MKSAKPGRFFATCLAGTLLALCSGCINLPHINRCSVLSNQSVNLEKVDLNALEGQPTTGSTTGFSLFGVIPLVKPRLSTAVGQALLKHDADLLTDVVIRRQDNWAILLGWETITVEGTAVKTLAAKDGKQEG